MTGDHEIDRVYIRGIQLNVQANSWSVMLFKHDDTKTWELQHNW